jgi:hypothetical protein
VIQGDGLLYQRSFPFGGGYITAALVERFTLPFSAAENLKREINLSCAPLENEMIEAEDGESYSLDEVIDLPFPHYNASWTSDAFYYIFNNCYRLKNFTFKLQEDGTPYVMKWKNQTIDLSQNVGYTENTRHITNNTNFTDDTKIFDDATYQTLKDNPDSWASNLNYSRYNRTSAVNTINSLPDCSATGTNTIKFKGASGALTDGGAINTLTEEEIAVAAAKGWTVSLV